MVYTEGVLEKEYDWKENRCEENRERDEENKIEGERWNSAALPFRQVDRQSRWLPTSKEPKRLQSFFFSRGDDDAPMLRRGMWIIFFVRFSITFYVQCTWSCMKIFCCHTVSIPFKIFSLHRMLEWSQLCAWFEQNYIVEFFYVYNWI